MSADTADERSWTVVRRGTAPALRRCVTSTEAITPPAAAAAAVGGRLGM